MWSNWTECTKTCGGGQQTRIRNCTNPSPLHGGNNCTNLGKNVENRNCSTQNCPSKSKISCVLKQI